MQARFIDHVRKKQFWNQDESLLLALSGGVDSVVLAHLLHQMKVRFAMVHCNFKLRGKESEEDEIFCRNLAAKLKLKIHVTIFNVKTRTNATGESTQMAARDLRYTYFRELMESEGYDKLLTGHHLNDNIETVLINLMRGTGIKGLAGIAEDQQSLVRPLLVFTREEIMQYAVSNSIEYRTDSSNADDVYERNYIRHHLVPALRKISPSLEKVFARNIANFKMEAAVVEHYVQTSIRKLVKVEKDRTVIPKKDLKNEMFQEIVLYGLLAPMGFTSSQVDDLINCFNETGKKLVSEKYILFVERNELVIVDSEGITLPQIPIKNMKELRSLEMMQVERVKQFIMPEKNELFVEEKSLVFPMCIRAWKKGDRFRPFGLKGWKLVSDLFKDKKVRNADKESVRLLVNGNGDIIWVIGIRSDERYRISEPINNLIKLTWIEEG